MEISFDDFKKVEIRIGEIKEVEQIPKSKSLLKFIVDFGSETRQCVAGLLKYYTAEELLNKKFVFIMNLKRRKLMGIESQCMILAAEDETGNIVLITPQKEIAAGSQIV